MENLNLTMGSVSGYFPEFEPTGMVVDDKACEVDDVGVLFW